MASTPRREIVAEWLFYAKVAKPVGNRRNGYHVTGHTCYGTRYQKKEE